MVGSYPRQRGKGIKKLIRAFGIDGNTEVLLTRLTTPKPAALNADQGLASRVLART